MLQRIIFNLKHQNYTWSCNLDYKCAVFRVEPQGLIILMCWILQWNWRSIVIGLAFLAFLLGTKFLVYTILLLANHSVSAQFTVQEAKFHASVIMSHLLSVTSIITELVSWDIESNHFCCGILMQAKKKKKLFWIAAIAPLISVILSTLFVFITRADKYGVKIVSSIQY